MSLLSVNDLQVYYGSIHAIKGISFDVNEGEIVTLIGANGAGKSTTLNTIGGLLKPRSGSVEFEGASLLGTAPHKIVSKGMALCPEGRRVFLQLSVQENLEMGAYTRPKGEIADSIDQVYEQFPRLKERCKQVAGTLSGGEQQMLAMGRALMSKPKLLMLDEPSMGLAPLLVEQYKTVTLVDLRYMMSSLLPQYVDFAGQDVLFLYNEQVVNHSEMLK